MTSRKMTTALEAKPAAPWATNVAGACKIGLRGLALIVLATGITTPATVRAYNVCSDDDEPCTHEVMSEQGLDLYYHFVTSSGMPQSIAQEVLDHKASFLTGVGNPDQFDPLYGNAGLGDALITITHFWNPDGSLGAPMELDYLGADDYPNAFQAASALWTRALGEYAAGNKEGAYRYLGMVAHFLGDQTIPTHVHNDTHGPDILDDDAFEEWMSVPAEGDNGGDSPRAFLSSTELTDLRNLGMLENPMNEIDDQLLWLFLVTNQVADYFASDDRNGDPNHPGDPRVRDWAKEALDQVTAACAAEAGEPGKRPPGCPTTTDRLVISDFLAPPIDFTGDLGLIRKHSYVPGIRNMAALFSVWEKAVTKPTLTVTIQQIKEIGDYEGDCGFLEICSGMDSILKPDFYVGMVMGFNQRSCGGSTCGDPIGAYLEDRNGNVRSINGAAFPSNVTRADAFHDNTNLLCQVLGGRYCGTEDQTIVWPYYHFGQSYSYAVGDTGYVAGEDIVDITLAVWENDESAEITNDPFDSDDLADINPQNGRLVYLSVDLAQCLSGAADAVTIAGIGAYACGPSIRLQGTGDDTDDVRVLFSVSMSAHPDNTPPEIECAAADGVWHQTDARIRCTATDDGIGLANPADAAFFLTTSEPNGTETDAADTGTREVCDSLGNCATAGPVGGNKVDKKTPVITITQPAAAQYTHSETLRLDYSVTDGGSGVQTVVPTMNGSTTIAGNGLPSGQAIDLLTSLPLGANTFTVNAVDNVSNASSPASVTFTIIVTPQSIIDAVDIFWASGEIESTTVRSLLAKLSNAKKHWDRGECSPAENIYGAFINEVQAQRGKSITQVAADILITDAQYLITHCSDGHLLDNLIFASGFDAGGTGEWIAP